MAGRAEGLVQACLVLLVALIVFTPGYEAMLFYLKANLQNFYTFPAVADNLAVGCLLAVLAPRLPRIPGYAAVVMFLVVALAPFFSADSASRTLFLVFVPRPAMQFSIAGVLLHVVQSPPPRTESCTGCVAGAHQLQPLFMATAVLQCSLGALRLCGSAGACIRVHVILRGGTAVASPP